MPWALVTRSEAPLPAGLDQHDWEATRDRTAEDTNADVRQEVHEHGYCLIQTECDFEQLARELEHAAVSVESSALPEGPSAGSPAEYHFYVHRTLKAWRMAFCSRERVAPLTQVAHWRFSRSRTGENTAPSVRNEVAQRGYCLFKIGDSIEQLGTMLRR